MAITLGAEFLVRLGSGDKSHIAIEVLRDGKRITMSARCNSKKSGTVKSIISREFTSNEVTCEICKQKEVG